MSLPIDAVLPEILAALESHSGVVIEAPPGAGKTTRVPREILGRVSGEVLVLEPRRLAARMAAKRVAGELGERIGETVGYQVRFEEIAGRTTRLRFLTEGVLTRRLLSDPMLKGVSVVVLDEFHERHMDGDLALALLRRLQRGARPDLKIIVMSATLHTASIAQYLGNIPVVRSEGRLYPLEIEYTPHSALPLEEQVVQAFARLREHTGDILVFLPGAAEIRKSERLLRPIAERAAVDVFALHGDLSPEEQDRAVARGPRRKIILSTNVAESSVTIEGVTAVIDSGLARVPSDSPWSGISKLEVRRVSQASATQRAGRAGRTAPGRVIRLYTAEDFHRRPQADTPELLRRELSSICLQLRAMKVESLEWLDAPPEAAWDAASLLLTRLRATEEMAELPLAPRLAKLVLEAAHAGVPEKGCAVAAVISSGERGSTDLLTLAEGQWLPQTQKIYDQLRRRIRGKDKTRDDSAILQSILAAFPDRVAKHRRDGELLLATGDSAVLPGCQHEWLVAVDVEDRRERGLPLVRIASKIEPEWLLDRAVEVSGTQWNRSAMRVEQVTALKFEQLVLDETRAPGHDPEMLFAKAKEHDIGRFVDREALEQLQSRAAFAGLTTDVDAKLRELCEHCSSFAELESAGLLSMLRPAGLEREAPERLTLPGGRSVAVHYEPGKPPWIESRLQDFFGVKETPRIHGTPVVVHLLAPNRRPVQVTSDLAGFWERLYPQVRRELSRRYPKHKWPEKPLP